MMFPEIANMEFNEEDKNLSSSNETSSPGITYSFNFEKGEFDLVDGNPKKIEGTEAVKQWISKILYTQKYKFKIYEKYNNPDEYGVVLQELLIGNNLPYPLVESEVRREIIETLTKHPMIRDISDLNIEKNNPIIKISFKVELESGENFKKVVSY